MLDPLTYTPDWRYGIALKEIEREEAGLPIYRPSKDPYIVLLKRVVRMRSGRYRVDPDALMAYETTKAATLALRLYEDVSAGGMRDTMEAALLDPNAPHDFFVAQVNPLVTVETIHMYSHLFYDVQECVNRPFWVQRNLFVPNKYISDNIKFDSAYMWKVVAYHGGTKYLTQYAIDGCALVPELRNWVRQMGVSEHVKTVLKSSHTYAKLIDGAGTSAISVTSTWDKADAEGQADNSADAAGVSEAIGHAIEPPRSDLIQEAEQITSRKFEDEEPKK